MKGVSLSTRGNKDHNSLVHNGCQQSFGSKYYKRLVPTGCWHLFWSQDDKWMVPAAVGTRLGGLPRPEGEAPSLPEGEHGSEVATAFQLSAFVWGRR